MNNESTRAELNPPIPAEAKNWMNSLKKGAILRYKIDIFSVLTVLIAVTVQFVAYWTHWPWYSVILIIILMREAHLVEHNHAHLTIFKNTFLNEALGWLMFLNCGIPLQSYREQHVLVHHRNLGTSKDWTSPWAYKGTTFPDKPVNKFYYFLTFMALSIAECTNIYLRKPLSKSTLFFILSFIVVAMIAIILARHSPSSFILFYLIPWIVTYVYLAIASWKQHVGCEYNSVYTTAFNDFNIDSRRLGFNIGYHTAHHWYPNLHWSLLPKFHEIYLAAHIPARYYVPIWFSSIISYFRTRANIR